MYDLDCEEFWKKDDLSHGDNCFDENAPQVAFGIRMNDECVFAELDEPGNPWGQNDPIRMVELRKRYNDKAEKIVGRRLLSEAQPGDRSLIFPKYREIGELFGGKYVFKDTWWLEKSCSTNAELEQALDRFDRLDLKSFILPDNWEREKKRIFEQSGKKPYIHRYVRGPVTLAMSLFGCENLIFLIMDEPELAKRFSQAITKAILFYIQLFNEEAESNVPGFYFFDDDCCLLNAEMYELFGYPVLKEVFEFASPNPGDERYQHSDSDMAHLLPVLGKLNLTGCNFGPTLTVDQIRKYLPRTRIEGQMAPFTFMSNDAERIIAEVRRDCEAAKRCGRGININTAGGINNGSLLESMRVAMYAVSKYGQF